MKLKLNVSQSCRRKSGKGERGRGDGDDAGASFFQWHLGCSHDEDGEHELLSKGPTRGQREKRKRKKGAKVKVDSCLRTGSQDVTGLLTRASFPKSYQRASLLARFDTVLSASLVASQRYTTWETHCSSAVFHPIPGQVSQSPTRTSHAANKYRAVG